MAQTLNELLSWGKGTLRSAGIEDFNVSAELLLRSLLNLNRSQLILKLNDTVSSEITAKYKGLIEKRASHVPLQYLTGSVEFYNVTLITDPRALIPRPETEILVATILEKLDNAAAPSFLDIGTGSGNIAIALAKNLPGAYITGIDISRDALDLASINAKLNQVEKQTSFIPGNIFDDAFVGSLGLFDCVVSNPPYVPSSDKSVLQPEVTENEPEVAIFVDGDSLSFFKTIVANISYILKTGGLLAFEVGLGQAKSVADLMAPDFNDITIVKDLAGIERVVTGIYAGIGKE